MKSSLRSAPLLLSLLLVACSTAPREASRAPAPTPASTPAPAPAAPTTTASTNRNLRRGMAEAEVRTLWGEPKAVYPGKVANETILVYDFDVLTTQRMVAATVNEIQAYDPIDGSVRTLIDPVLSPQKVTVTQTIVLQLVDGKLVSWARQLGEQRSFN